MVKQIKEFLTARSQLTVGTSLLGGTKATVRVGAISGAKCRAHAEACTVFLGIVLERFLTDFRFTRNKSVDGASHDDSHDGGEGDNDLHGGLGWSASSSSGGVLDL